MNKVKYLHTKKKLDGCFCKTDSSYQRHAVKRTPYEDSPYKESMSKKHFWSYTRTHISFEPLRKFLIERIGYHWDDVYSEIVKKTLPKYRYLLENQLEYYLVKPTYFIDFLPYVNRYPYNYKSPKFNMSGTNHEIASS